MTSDRHRIIAGKVCQLKRYLFTHALEVGIVGSSYERRYCFEHELDAASALESWTGEGHPPGPWIKCKSANSELLNPQWARE